MDEPDSMASKLKEFLGRKLAESNTKIKKLKRKNKIYNIAYIITTLLSIVISSGLASISLLTIPPLVFTILAFSSAVLTGISFKFNIQDRALLLKQEIDVLDKIRSKLDYVISCNGNLTSETYQQIISEFKIRIL